jgi:hypothetical protein
LGGINNSRFELCDATGGFSVAAIGLETGASGNIFKGCIASTNSGGGVDWLLPTGSMGTSGAPDIFIYNSTDGGQPFANLPTVSVFGATGICTDSTDPTWTTGGTPVSNVGKPIVGGGTYRVTARWATVSPTLAAAASWTTGNNTITMALANPGSVVANMGVIDLTTKSYVGKVLTYVGTTLTLTTTAATASSGSADNLVFGTWCIAG